jgi:hypothetical protein
MTALHSRCFLNAEHSSHSAQTTAFEESAFIGPESRIKDSNGLAGCALGGLQWVDLLCFLGRRGFCQVCGHGAPAGSPLDGRLRKDEAVIAGGKVLGFLASDALFNDLVACTSIELASVLVHEKTLDTLLHAVANHGNHILSNKFLKK